MTVLGFNIKMKLGLVVVRLGMYLRSVLHRKLGFELGYKLGDGDHLDFEIGTGLDVEHGLILQNNIGTVLGSRVRPYVMYQVGAK